jgi:excisionase family DNA binding protein
LQEYYTLKRLTAYCGIGLRTLRMYLTHPEHPLPHYRVGGKILVKRSEFEIWIQPFRRSEGPRVEAMVAEVLKDL